MPPSRPEPGAEARALADRAEALGGAVDVASPDDADLRETVVGSKVVWRDTYLTLRIDTVRRADGSSATREIVGHPGAVAILAVDDDDGVILVRQWRAAAGRAMLEIPAGTLDVDETGATEPHDRAAARELEEETGYRAADWRLLASFWTAPGFATELMHLYLATGLSPAHADRLGPDEDERLHLVRLPRREALALVTSGGIVDAKSILALLWLERLRSGAE